MNLAWFTSSWFMCGNERGVAASSQHSPVPATRRQLTWERYWPFITTFFSFFFPKEGMLLTLPLGETCCLSQFLSFLMEFCSLPYRWTAATLLAILWTCSNTICPCSKDASLLPSVGNTRQFILSVGWSRRNVVAQVANLWKINETFRDEMMKCPFLAREALVSNAFINCFLQGQNVIDAHRITQLCGCLLSNS